MLYAICRTDVSGANWWLLPACFDSADVLGHRYFPRPVCFNVKDARCWIKEDTPDHAAKHTTAGDAVMVAESLNGPYPPRVIPLPGTGNAYELPMDPKAAEDLAYRILALAPAPDVPPVDVIRSFVPRNGKAS